MTTPPITPDQKPLSWQQVIDNTGYLSFEQAKRHFGLVVTKDIAPQDVIVFHNALWQRDKFHRGAHERHRYLVSESYIRLYPKIMSWQFAGSYYRLCPDAVIQLPLYPYPVLLEMDTGKETAKQWRSKLTAYRLEAVTNPHFALWIIATGGPLRLKRLQEWISQYQLACSWHLCHLDEVQSHVPHWHSLPLPASAVDQQAKTMRHHYYLLSNRQPISSLEAEAKLKQGWIVGAKEITTDGVISYLSPGPKGF
ncbi:hypothetical protein [Sulfobacillus thermosulfidooxidans]|uniref:hypothetical protein n=1 Tax=Sulfobacillus thermosulfidooxidans TaxID=28034 RepID=UPI0006B5D2A1|nr:hypothetical protein [Sulfobacillus thermosulfidooxidans]